MSFPATVLKVLVASPGDVKPERAFAKEAIHAWNDVHSVHRGVILLPVLWETSATPAMGARGQEIINRQLVRDADLLVGIFWTRIGIPTGVAASGTVEEINEHLSAGKPTMLYFSGMPVAPESLDRDQFDQLTALKTSLRGRGLVQDYVSHEDFRDKFGRHLAMTINQMPIPTPASPDVPAGDDEGTREADERTREAIRADLATMAPALSEEARQLLLEAVHDPHGTVIATTTFAGFSVETNGKKLFDEAASDARTAARWRAAVQELVTSSFLEQLDTDGEVLRVMDSGYAVSE